MIREVFANQALGAQYIVKNASEMDSKVYLLPKEVGNEIAKLKLASIGIEIDTLTEEQEKYLASWQSGT